MREFPPRFAADHVQLAHSRDFGFDDSLGSDATTWSARTHHA